MAGTRVGGVRSKPNAQLACTWSFIVVTHTCMYSLALADAGFQERGGGVVVEGGHQKGEGAGGGCAPSGAKRGSF